MCIYIYTHKYTIYTHTQLQYIYIICCYMCTHNTCVHGIALYNIYVHNNIMEYYSTICNNTDDIEGVMLIYK